MATKNVTLLETFGDYVTDFNGLGSDVGDLTLLTTSTKASVVAAINELDSNIGARSSLTTTDKTSLVAAINEISAISGDSSTIVSIARGGISVTDAGGDGSLSYNNGTGVITYTGPSASEVRAHLSAGARLSYSSGQFNVADAGIDSAALGSLSISTGKVQNSAITSAKLASAVTLIIYNSAGTAIKTLYGAGS